MTGRRAHIATQWQVAGGGSILRCMCGEWESDRTQTLRVQRDAHRAHRVEMGERVAAVRPSLSERVAAVRALHVPVKRGALVICDACSPKRGDGPARYFLAPHPCPTVRALDGDLGEAS